MSITFEILFAIWLIMTMPFESGINYYNPKIKVFNYFIFNIIIYLLFYFF